MNPFPSKTGQAAGKVPAPEKQTVAEQLVQSYAGLEEGKDAPKVDAKAESLFLNASMPSFKNLRGQKVWNAAGNPIKEVAGVLFPASQEEVECCLYFVSLGYIEQIK